MTAIQEVCHQVVTTRLVRWWHHKQQYVALHYEDKSHEKLVIQPEPFSALLKNDDVGNENLTNQTLEDYYTRRQLGHTTCNGNNNTRNIVVNADQIIFMNRTVVECIGLTENTDLNGKQGIVVGCNLVNERYKVNFGKTLVGKKLVPRNRLIIVFTRSIDESE